MQGSGRRTGSAKAGLLGRWPVGSGPGGVLCVALGLGLLGGDADRATPLVILVSIDTLRADHVGAYRKGRSPTPNLDRLAGQSDVYLNAFTVAPSTLPAHASMLTGFYPHEHGAGFAPAEKGLSPSLTTLAEYFQEHGYFTAAVAGGGYVRPAFGFEQGFGAWREVGAEALHDAVSQLLGFVDEHSAEPCFLFLHTYATHAPYVTLSTEDDDLLADVSIPADRERAWKAFAKQGSSSFQEMPLGEESIGQLSARYLAGVRRMDAAIAKLLDGLKSRQRFDQALIVVTSDHGEALFDRHNYVGHGDTLFDEELVAYRSW